MRKDAIGLFWQDEPKKNEKREIPHDYWNEHGYLPDNFNDVVIGSFRNTIGDTRLIALAEEGKTKLFFDIETYQNYYCVNFTEVDRDGSKRYLTFECRGNVLPDLKKLKWVLETFTQIGFNSNAFDCPIAAIICSGRTTEAVKAAADILIVGEVRKEDMLKSFGVTPLRIDSIDLIEVAPLKASLKIYGGRLHTPYMQDLPYKPDTVLTEDQMLVVNEYCFNDNENTILMAKCLSEQIKLREEMSVTYGIDLRSKSDAQIAEAVISQEIKKIQGKHRLQKPKVEPGRVYQYQPPYFLRFKTDLMKNVLKTVCQSPFRVAAHGGVEMPEAISALTIKINQTEYTMGIGGLHSCEKVAVHVATQGYRLRDRDVASYYPFIIINCGLYPEHLGPDFLIVYKKIVDERIAAKRAGKKAIADSLKITINGSFGKLGSMYSILYAPNLMIQVTVTGQLSLLMLIERLESAGIQVVSANTDGIVIKSHESQDSVVDEIIRQWEIDTGFETEETEYLALFSRDVNNYVAIKKKFDKEKKIYLNEPDGFKGKGVFADPWADKSAGAMVLHKNPAAQVCVQAAVHRITTGESVANYIYGCSDITRFCSVRTVKGGAYKEGFGFLGKSVRWYYAVGSDEPIVYANSGNKVPKTEGAKPLMTLPYNNEIPEDLDYGWYIREAESLLVDLGFSLPPV